VVNRRNIYDTVLDLHFLFLAIFCGDKKSLYYFQPTLFVFEGALCIFVQSILKRFKVSINNYFKNNVKGSLTHL